MNLSSVETLLRDRIGLDSLSLGPAALPRAVLERMRHRGMSDPAVYARCLHLDAEEWSRLLSHLLVPETWFFRGGRPLFDHLASWVRDRAAALSRSRPVRVLSIPCSTGEEPYSLSIAFREFGLTSGDFRIDAVDLSADHLARAQTGSFSDFSFRDPTFDPRKSYFLRAAGERWELQPQFRESVHFQVGNVIDGNLLAESFPYDLILARNLFIYQTPEGCRRAFENLERLLASDGRLCLTPAEADRLPAGRFALDGSVAFAVHRRSSVTGSAIIPPLEPRVPLSGVQPVSAHRSGSIPAATPQISAAEHPQPIRSESTAISPIVTPLELARALADAGKIEDARLACERLLESHSSADGFALLGVIHIAASRRSEASGAFRKALYLDPDHTEALAHMIGLHEERGERESAAALTRRLDRVRRRDTA